MPEGHKGYLILNTINKGIQDLVVMMINGDISCRELISSSLNRIDAMEEKIGAFLTLRREEALKEAESIDNLPVKSKLNMKLPGIPIAIKDNISTMGIETTCASKILKGYIPPYDATVIERLKESGAIIIGKANMDEFAMGSSTENSAFKLTHNPWDLKRSPGGSSGGSTAAVAAGMVPISLGSDTGGSVKQPAAFCGVTGLRPTYGRISRYGLIAFASSMDQIGPIAKSVSDCALLFSAISGFDERDSTSANIEPFDNNKIDTLPVLRIGVPKEYFGKGLDSDVSKEVQGAINILEGEGNEIKEIQLPHTEYGIETYYLIANAEASSNLARFDSIRYGLRKGGEDLLDLYNKTRGSGFGLEVKRRILLGTYALSAGYYDAYYGQAQRARTKISEDFKESFKEVDVIIGPTTPTPAFILGEKVNDPLSMYLNDIYTIPSNLAGLPAVSIPCGLTSDNLPVGLQLIGKPFDEKRLFELALFLERALAFDSYRPAI